MPRKKIKPAPLSDWKGFYEELQSEKPRAAVIIAAAFMDGWLRQLIANFMVDDAQAVDNLLGAENNSDCPLSSFSARTKASYCLGLISKDEYDDLNTIRRIRNQFAHRMHDLSFDDEKIVSWCNSLQIPKETISALTDFPKSHKTMFLVGVSMLTSRLALRALAAERYKRTILKGFELAQVISV